MSTTVQTVGIAWYGITWYGMVSTAQRGAAPSRKMPPEYSCDNSSCECSCHLPKKEDKSQRFQKLRFSSIFFFFFRTFKVERLDGESWISFYKGAATVMAEEQFKLQQV